MKRQCQSCGAKFFDLARDPIVCPKCGTTFQPVALSRAPARAAASDDDSEADTGNVELVSLEDADAGDDKVVVAAGTMTVYDTDDTTVLFTGTVTTAAGDPISAIDPA